MAKWSLPARHGWGVWRTLKWIERVHRSCCEFSDECKFCVTQLPILKTYQYFWNCIFYLLLFSELFTFMFLLLISKKKHLFLVHSRAKLFFIFLIQAELHSVLLIWKELYLTDSLVDQEIHRHILHFFWAGVIVQLISSSKNDRLYRLYTEIQCLFVGSSLICS